MQRYRAGVIVILEACLVLLLCAYTLLNLVSGLLLPSLYVLIQFTCLVCCLFFAIHKMAWVNFDNATNRQCHVYVHAFARINTADAIVKKRANI